MSMFCNQCQETAKNSGCTIKGVCGKSDLTANLQDLLIYTCQGLSMVTIHARKNGFATGKESRFIVNSLFMTITNANFDEQSIISAINQGIRLRDELICSSSFTETNEYTNWKPGSDTELHAKAATSGVLTFDADENIRGLKQYVLYGL